MNDSNVGDVNAKIHEARTRIDSVIVQLNHLWAISDVIYYVSGESHPSGKELLSICLLLEGVEEVLGTSRNSKVAVPGIACSFSNRLYAL